jgi:hypothetical protein
VNTLTTKFSLYGINFLAEAGRSGTATRCAGGRWLG